MNAHTYKIKPSTQFGWVARCSCCGYVTASYTREHVQQWIDQHIANAS